MRRYLFGVSAVLIALALIIPAASAAAGQRKVVLGVSIEHHWWESSTYDTFANQVGNRPRMWTLWSQWGNANKQFPAAQAAWVAARGAVPFIFWEPIRSIDSCDFARHRETAAGVHDAYIRSFARAAKRHGKTIMLRWAHEINGAFFPWGTARGQCGNTVSDYKAAWKRIVRIFRAEKASNVKFVWTVARASCPGGCNPYKGHYPGNKWVHYVGFSNFNWGAYKNNWTPMIKGVSEVMAKFRQFTSKPVIIAENASNTLGGDKPDWIRDGYPTVYRRYPQVKAIVYLNVDLSRIGHPDWSLNTPGWTPSVGRSDSHRAYESIADQGRFRGRFR